MDRGPLQATPFLALVIGAGDDDNEVGFFVIKLREIDAEVAPRELRLVIFVVENRRLAESLREDARDLRDEVPLFPREGKGDPEPLGTRI